MNENETTTAMDERETNDERVIANMDEYDFMNLLLESRILS